MCHQSVVWNFVLDCIRSNLRGCKFNIFLGRHAPQTPLVGTHTLCMLLSSCYHSVFPSPKLRILYENLSTNTEQLPVSDIIIVAVPCRNRKLFRCVFRALCCVWTTVSLNFRGSYMLRRCMNTLRSAYEPHPLCKFSDTALWRQQCDQNKQQNNFQFLHGTVTYVFCFIFLLQNLLDRNHCYVQFSFCQTLHVYSVACMSYAITVLIEMLQRTWLWQFSFKSKLKKVWYTILHYIVVKLAVSVITSQVWYRGIAKMRMRGKIF